jgi:hypothetical protein
MRTFQLAAIAIASTIGLHRAAVAQFTPAPVPNALPNRATAPFTNVPGPTPGPGTLTVHMNGRINSYVAAGSDSGRNPGPVTTGVGAAQQSSR